MDEEVFKKSNLEAISRVGTGMNNVDLKAAKNYNANWVPYLQLL